MDKPLDVEQLEKRVEWLDNERRSDKTQIASLQSKLEAVETENATLRQRLADLDSEITRLNTLMARLENIEQDLNNLDTETNRQINTFKESLQETQIRTERHRLSRRIETHFLHYRSTGPARMTFRRQELLQSEVSALRWHLCHAGPLAPLLSRCWRSSS